MTSAYPPIKPNRTWFLVALGLMVAELIYLAVIYPSLPQQIPVHYNFWGRVDGWADKSIWSVFGLTFVLPALLALVWWSGVVMGRMASKDASARAHDAFSPHAGKQGAAPVSRCTGPRAGCQGLLCPPSLCPDASGGSLLCWSGSCPGASRQSYQPDRGRGAGAGVRPFRSCAGGGLLSLSDRPFLSRW